MTMHDVHLLSKNFIIRKLQTIRCGEQKQKIKLTTQIWNIT